MTVSVPTTSSQTDDPGQKPGSGHASGQRSQWPPWWGGPGSKDWAAGAENRASWGQGWC